MGRVKGRRGNGIGTGAAGADGGCTSMRRVSPASRTAERSGDFGKPYPCVLRRDTRPLTRSGSPGSPRRKVVGYFLGRSGVESGLGIKWSGIGVPFSRNAIWAFLISWYGNFSSTS